MLMKEFKGLKGKISFKVPMSRYTTMRIGGPAALLYEPASLSDLIGFIKLIKQKKIFLLVIGNGSNIIVKDAGTRKAVVRLSNPFFKRIEACGADISCGSGVSLAQFCRMAEAKSLSGCEFLTGIPGTIGGAIAQNAGAYGSSISDILKDVRCIDKGARVKILKREEIDFGYRGSGLKGHIILGATFCLKKSAGQKIRHKISGYIEKRLNTQDYTAPSAGCIFKNPKDLSAGELIDRCGLKGMRIGGASISQKHANFIINKNRARAKDVLALIALVKNKVRDNFGIGLEEEVEIIG